MHKLHSVKWEPLAINVIWVPFFRPKLKGLKRQDRSPKAPDLYKFPKHESKSLKRYQTHKSTALRRTPRGGGAHGPPRLSGESLRGTLVPRSRSSPTKVTAPGSAIAFKIQRLSWDPRECSAASPPLKANKGKDNLQTRQDHNILPYIIAITERKLADNLPNTETRKRGFQRSPRGGGQTPTAYPFKLTWLPLKGPS